MLVLCCCVVQAKAPITQTLTELEELGLVQFTPTDVFITATVQAAIRYGHPLPSARSPLFGPLTVSFLHPAL